MKTAKILPILLLAAVIALHGCKKNNPAPKVSNLMTFTLQGKKYTIATPYLVTVEPSNLTIGGGGGWGGPGLDIVIMNYQQGTNFSLYSQAYVNPKITNEMGNSYFCDKGQLVISSLTQTHISGTFSGTAVKVGDNTQQESPISGTFDADIPQ